jgi:tetratricopeptide (TPR) repeat protein
MKLHDFSARNRIWTILLAAVFLGPHLSLAQDRIDPGNQVPDLILRGLDEDSPKLNDKAYQPLEKLPEIEKPKSPEKPDELHPQAVRAFEQGLELFKQQDYLGAINKYERAVGFNPRSAALHRALALVYERLPNYAKAFEHVQKAVSLAGDDLKAQLLYGAIALRRKQTQTAIEAFRTALITSEASPENPQAALALLQLASALEKQGYYQAASDAYAKLSQWVDKHGQKYAQTEALQTVVVRPEILWINQGLLQLKLGKYAQAAELLSKAQKRDRSNRGVSISLLVALVRGKKLDEAQQHLLNMLDEPALAEVAAKVAPTLIEKTANPQLPLQIWNKAKTKEAGTSDLALALAASCRRLDKPEHALKILEEALEMHPGRTELAQQLAETYARMGRHLEAMQRFAVLIRQNPGTDRALRRAIALVAGDQPKPELFQAVKEKAQGLDPAPRSGLYYVAGRLAQQMDQSEKAAQLFQQAIQADAGMLPAYEAIVELHVAKGQYQEAEKLLERLAGEAQGHFPLYLAGKLRLRRGDAAGALELLQKAHESNPRHVETKVLLAKVYVRTGRKYEAGQMFLSAASLAPGDPGVAKPMIHHYLRRRRFNEALSAATNLIDNAPESPKALALLAEAAYAAGQDRKGDDALADLREIAPDSIELQVIELYKKRSKQPGMLDKKTWDEYVNRLNVLTFADPDHVGAQAMLADLFGDHAKYDLAATIYSELSKRTWQRPDIVLQEAVAFLRAGKPEKACKALERLLANDPESYSGKRLYLDSLLRRKEYKQAAQTLGKWLDASEPDPLAVWYRWSLIDVLDRAKDYDAAIEALNEWMKEDASFQSEKRTEWIRLQVDAGRYDQAVSTVTEWAKHLEERAGQAEDLDTRSELLNSKSLLRRALVYNLVDADENQRALKLLDEWIGDKTDPSVEPLRTLRIVMLGEMDQVKEASRLALEWIRNDATALAPRQALISVLSQEDKHAEAAELLDRWEAELKKIAADDPSRADVAQVGLDWISHAKIANAIGADDYKRALEQVEKLLKESPDDGELLQLKATCLGELGKSDAQTDILERLLAQNPNDPLTNNNLGYYYADRGENLARAEQLIRKSLEREPGSTATQDSLGWVLYKQGRFSSAGEIFLQIMQSGKEHLELSEPDMPSNVHAIIFDHAGDTFYRLGWPELATEAWSLALKAARRAERKSSDLTYVRTKTPGKIEAVKADGQPAVADYDEDYLKENPETPDAP